MINVLEAIVDYKRQVIANTADVFELSASERNFKAALEKKHFGFIMECKKASPSKGLIKPDFDLNHIVGVYNKYADAISVLTEDKYFQGSFNNLQKVSQLTDKPVLCKDFILEPKQVRLARYYGADAVLLMLSVLDDEQYIKCQEQAKALNMDVLTEVHDRSELNRAILLGSDIIGINNRNLKNLNTSLDTTKQLADLIPSDRLVITESGISEHSDVIELAPYADACLVGSSLMASDDLLQAAQQLVYGDIKICGVTNQQDSNYLEQEPTSCLGVIFAENSKRKVSEVFSTIEKPLVGVFQNQNVDFIISKVKQYRLKAVQLHGDESQDFINCVRAAIEPDVKLMKVVHINGNPVQMEFENVDEILLDSQIGHQQGGTGSPFDWDFLSHSSVQSNKEKVRIAGGIDSDNIQRLKQLGFSKIDICSGSEETYGSKCRQKVTAVFNNAKLVARYK